MAPNRKVVEACKAMKSFNIHHATVKKVLKDLLKVYENNWTYIEVDNYQVLLEAILNYKEAQRKKQKKENLRLHDESDEEELEPLVKKSRQKKQMSCNLCPRITRSSLTKQIRDESESGPEEVVQHMEKRPSSSETSLVSKQSEASRELCEVKLVANPVSPRSCSNGEEEKSKLIFVYKRKPQLRDMPLGKEDYVSPDGCSPKNKSCTDVLPEFEAPLAIIHPDVQNQLLEYGSTNRNHPPAEEVESKFPEVICLDEEDTSTISKDEEQVHAINHPEKRREMKTFDADKHYDSSSLAVVETCQSLELCNNPCLLADISRGIENREISLVNEVNNEKQPVFTYVSRNVVYKSAYAKFLLARISEKDCCSKCKGNCLLVEKPCACARETGYEFAYKADGSIEENFLQSCILITNCPQKQHHFYCENCPVDRSKGVYESGSCEGHLVRRFIKECWYKCGCGRNCGNRVVQRGITANLQVFMTSEGKGWGLRTLEDLPKGAFICEYVGEIVTTTELFKRSLQNASRKHAYNVILDAGWSSVGFLKDEKALCLDATCFGNVARFINHRCYDANLVAIPIEVESPDRHYYHHAFFTTREVKALEELTWDYGIDFEDGDHLFKAFRCQCGSEFCRNLKRKRSRRCNQ